jgi:hypothetical protein
VPVVGLDIESEGRHYVWGCRAVDVIKLKAVGRQLELGQGKMNVDVKTKAVDGVLLLKCKGTKAWMQRQWRWMVG